MELVEEEDVISPVFKAIWIKSDIIFNLWYKFFL